MEKKAFFQNTSDKETPALVAAGFVRHSFEMLGELVAPGDIFEVTEAEAFEIRKTHANLLKVGAITEVEKLAPAPPPQAYVPPGKKGKSIPAPAHSAHEEEQHEEKKE